MSGAMQCASEKTAASAVTRLHANPPTNTATYSDQPTSARVRLIGKQSATDYSAYSIVNVVSVFCVKLRLLSNYSATCVAVPVNRLAPDIPPSFT
jgi:hypothetical protein